MDKDNLKKLNKKELIKVIDSYKERLAVAEEYMKVMTLEPKQSF
ncbi:MAG: hypothetical protein ABIH49_00880 [archaeon]